MEFKAKKLISVRLDTDDLQVINDWVANDPYYGRSDVVDAAVRLAAWMIKNGYAQKLIRFWPKSDTVDDFQLDYHR